MGYWKRIGERGTSENRMNEEISGEKIECEGHEVEKPRLCVLSDGHKGKCVKVKHGRCVVTKPFRWKK